VRAAQGANPVFEIFQRFKSRKANAFGTTASTIKAEVTFVTSLLFFVLKTKNKRGLLWLQPSFILIRYLKIFYTSSKHF